MRKAIACRRQGMTTLYGKMKSVRDHLQRPLSIIQVDHQLNLIFAQWNCGN